MIKENLKQKRNKILAYSVYTPSLDVLHLFGNQVSDAEFNKKNHVKTKVIAYASLKSFYPRLGFTVIKDFATYTNFEAACSRFHYEKGKSKAE